MTDQNRRPILGYVNLNVFRGGMILNKNLLDENVNTAIHEIFHAMGFSGHMVRHFPPSLGASYLHRRRTTRSPRRKRTRRRMD